jgi:NhaP-type Na+/H+ or K+/H+ antiporter
LFSFFFFLALAEWVSDKIFKAGLIGQILVGMLYGVPIGNIMPIGWQETFISLGYIGLILIIFEGKYGKRQTEPRAHMWQVV